LTLATIRVPNQETQRFGIVGMGDDYRVNSFIEKPEKTPSNLANMGVYVFNIDVLDRALWEDRTRSNSTHDFGKDIIPQMIARKLKVYAYPYSGYWVDVGTFQTYWQAHMDLLNEPPPLDLTARDWVIHTRTEERPPMRISAGAVVEDSMICNGAIIEAGAHVHRSVLSPGVVVQSGATVYQSVILTDTVIGPGVRLSRAIVDKKVVMKEKAFIGVPDEGADLTVIGKGSEIPPGMVVEPGATIGTDVIASDYPGPVVKSGETIQTRREPNEI
jgi:glucose-1-phosphate adenylyltransferase